MLPRGLIFSFFPIYISSVIQDQGSYILLRKRRKNQELQMGNFDFLTFPDNDKHALVIFLQLIGGDTSF